MEFLICPKCRKTVINTTNLCYNYNPIHNCRIAAERIIHTHHFCDCGWETVTIENYKGRIPS